MPNTKSAIKAVRQNIKRRVTNLVVLEKIKSAIKKVKKAAAAANADEGKKALQEAFAALDKAAKKGVIHQNNADRKKSRLAKFLAKIK